jgi:DNA-binding MarR family transcriptional regulator
VTSVEQTAWVVALVAAVALILLVIAIRQGSQLRRTKRVLGQRIKDLESRLVLAQLGRYPGQAQSIEQLAHRLETSRDVLSSILGNLERRGYVRILRQDRRGRRISPHVMLTDAGRDALGR